MPRTDVVHNAIKNALVKDGWRVTHDPFIIEYEERKLVCRLRGGTPVCGGKRREKDCHRS